MVFVQGVAIGPGTTGCLFPPIDLSGKRSPVASTATVTGKDSRESRMTFGEGAGQHVMTIGYRRVGK